MKKNKKKYRKTLDKAQKVCYNIYVVRERKKTKGAENDIFKGIKRKQYFKRNYIRI